ncbi:hypothetical protein PGSY75_0411100 [Plasmodium gaboni]|uniref:Uncharacterized protein n=1 Tax=Plasmodium gaboni TaxID=647221 RepID=A0A151LUI0_9APIC|nr:hypothetical protein PGSY75_0411100 [Plasmodium gaboni]KYO02818.1 hypothetical protein PGSY75_0411100 [Plasmodium gaboni]SOV11261.1 conserved Plasmodium protein, unknown function [Plasmodium gaboni]SOV21091.1 conserved Plasmodium protein, unknown function [Plasmodium sp. DRC-Itaito]
MMFNTTNEKTENQDLNDAIEININNIANKLANILYITNVGMKENFELKNNLHFSKFLNDMRSYCVNLIQSINNLNSNFYNLTCLPVYSIPRNPYTNILDINVITNNISVDDNVDKIKEKQTLLQSFHNKYEKYKNNFHQSIKHIETFNDQLFSALNNLDHIKMSIKYKDQESSTYGNILSDRLKNKQKDHEHLELYIARIHYGLF